MKPLFSDPSTGVSLVSPPPNAAEPLEDLSAAHDEVGDARDEARHAADHSRAKRSFWRELPVLLVVALVLAVLIKTFLLQAFYIPSGSMEETLHIDDRVAVNKLSYRFGGLERGDVVVFEAPGGDSGTDESAVQAAVRNVAEAVGLSTPHSEFIKRVIGLPGETVEIRDGRVLIDGRVIDEPYLAPGTAMLRDFGPVTVPLDEVFVMGDNRDVSEDSRAFGTIAEEDIVGRAVAIIWPPSRWSGL